MDGQEAAPRDDREDAQLNEEGEKTEEAAIDTSIDEDVKEREITGTEDPENSMQDKKPESPPTTEVKEERAQCRSPRLSLTQELEE
eukprot:2323491-Karenia_brevis.AAC.1